MIKAILFDLDDTLYREKDFVMSGFKAVSKYISKKYNLKYSWIFSILKNDFNKGIRRKNFDVLIEKLNINKEEIEKCIKIYREHKPDIKLFIDARKIINKLKGDYKLGLITDGFSNTQKNKIERLGIIDYFDKIIINDPRHNVSKKDKKVFYKMLKALKIKGKEAIFVGDNLEKDFKSSSEIMHTAQVIRTNGEYINKNSLNNRVEFKIKSLLEIKKIIEELNEKI